MLSRRERSLTALQCHIVEAYLDVSKVVMSWASPSLTDDSQWQQMYLAVQYHARCFHCCFPKGRKGWARSSSGRAFFRLGEASACLRSFHCEASCSLILWEEGRKELLGRTCSAGCYLSTESMLRCGWTLKSFRTTRCKWSLGPRGWWELWFNAKKGWRLLTINVNSHQEQKQTPSSIKDDK